jgi:hypothetical protein
LRRKRRASFDLIRHHRTNERIFLYAFDLIELNGDDLRHDPLEVRKATPASIVAKAGAGTQDEESGLLGGEAGSGGGLGALTAPAGTFSAASDKTSTLRSPAFASSMMLLAMISSLRSRGHLMAARAISNATPSRGLAV